MDATVLQHKAALQKALEKGKDRAACDILDRLAEIKASAALLKKTEIGIFVTKLKKNANAEIATRASKILDKWKRDVGIQPKSAEQPTEKRRTPSVISLGSVTAPNGSETPRSTTSSSGDTTAAAAVPPRERSVALDKVNIPPTDNPVRTKCIELMYNALCIDNEYDSDHILALSVRLEAKLHEKHGQQVSSEYKMELRTYTSSIKNKQNAELRTSLLAGDLDPHDFVRMSAADLAPGPLKQQLEEARKRNLFLAQGASNIKAVTDQFRCGRCKKRRCSYFQMQTRSADEPMTTFVECLECGNNWKFC